MNFLNEFALLFAVATPLVVLFAHERLPDAGRRARHPDAPDLPTGRSPEGVADERQREENPANDDALPPRRVGPQHPQSPRSQHPDGRTSCPAFFTCVVTH